jgi:hypothetical protein
LVTFKVGLRDAIPYYDALFTAGGKRPARVNLWSPHTVSSYLTFGFFFAGLTVFSIFRAASACLTRR